MIASLKRKFIVSAMIAVTVLLLALLGVVNAGNAWVNSRETARLLENLIQMEGLRPPAFPDGAAPPSPPWGEAPSKKPAGTWEEGRGFMMDTPTDNDRLAAVYFTARVVDGTVVHTDVSHISSVSDEEAVAYTVSVLNEGKTAGFWGSFRYASGHTLGGETIYVFLENSNRRNAVIRVAVLSVLAGLGSWLLMLGLVVLLARRTIAPIAENMARQRQFVTDAGHEFKTPLAIIQANTEAMELIAGENKWSRNIKAQTARLTELTQDLLTLARTEEVTSEGGFAPLDLSDLAEKTAQMFQTPMEQKGLRLEAVLSPGVTVPGSEQQLGSLLSILFDNAVKYAARDTALRLTLKRDEKTCALRLENACEQLPDCPPDRLFDRFYRGDAARTQNSGGFGIGLSAARAIAVQHRGRLEAEYPAKDRIAFTVSLPLAGKFPRKRSGK